MSARRFNYSEVSLRRALEHHRQMGVVRAWTCRPSAATGSRDRDRTWFVALGEASTDTIGEWLSSDELHVLLCGLAAAEVHARRAVAR